MQQNLTYDFSIDRGGTFTDIFCQINPNQETVVMKLLSVDPLNYKDAPTEGIRRILNQYGHIIERDQKIPTEQIRSIRMGTTVATNALLERKGDKVALLITEGLRDTLKIGNQSRPDIFDLSIRKNHPIYETVLEIDERIRPMHAKFESGGFEGSNGQMFMLERQLDKERVKQQLQKLKEERPDITSLSVVLMHSYAYEKHEQEIYEIAKDMGYTQISLSSKIMQRVKLVKRGQTCCVDAYLNPHIFRYLENFQAGFGESLLKTTQVFFMQSDGGLAPIDKFTGSKAILSGPAGGVVGYSITSKQSQKDGEKLPVIGFDMGGTSTDVSRFDQEFEHIFETEIAGTSIQAPQLNISTVASGGGSRLFFQKGLYKVGPESCGADPGPVCYKKKGGMLAVTDANLLLGRLLPQFFPKIFGPNEDEELDFQATKNAFELLVSEINQESDEKQISIFEAALGFIKVANEAMARPIRTLTQARGFNPKNHILSVFGGAGAQHACAIAKDLGISRILIHRYCGILSAYGLGLADVVKEQEVPCQSYLEQKSIAEVQEVFKNLTRSNQQELEQSGFKDQTHQCFLNLRYEGTDTSIMVASGEGDQLANFTSGFEEQHKREFGFNLEKRKIIIDNIRVRSVGDASVAAQKPIEVVKDGEVPQEILVTETYFEGGYQSTKVFDLLQLKSGMKIQGPAIILNNTSTILVEPNWMAIIDEFGNVEIEFQGGSTSKQIEYKDISEVPLDPIELSIFGHRFMSIAEQMGVTLQRTAASVNIKERLDFSCALFDYDGSLVANAPHLPVHLGSMQDAVRFQVKTFGENWKENDVILANHPSAGGSHLPDMTIITPVFQNGKPVFYVASRGHHSDIGGIQPGSMPSFSKALEEEGAAFMGFKIIENGIFQEEKLIDILCNQTAENPKITGTRNLSDNLSDFKAQIAANNRGINLVKSLCEEYSLIYVQAQMKYIQDNAEQSVKSMLVQMAKRIEDSEIVEVKAVDQMDDGSEMKLKLTINTKSKTAVFDFTGTDPEMYGNCNAPRAITSSAIIYCLRSLVNTDIPLNQGCLQPVEIIVPEGCFINPSEKAAVVGGNVLTSQRLTDLVLKAFQACAASQGCMNNLTFGSKDFGYYETIAGGHGAGPTWHGQDGVHTHMTNTRITDPEVLEIRYPVALRQFNIREGSGGKGLFKGGDGVVREIEFLQDDTEIGILSERRAVAPYGLKGGQPGQKGKNLIIYPDGRIQNFGSKNSTVVKARTRIRLLTPGGGGYGQV